MCTVVLAFHLDRDVPVLVAANRDEFLDRPASPPAVRRHWGPPIAAPRDERAGGTWIGINQAGVVACLTNRFTGRAPHPARASRGEVVPLALHGPRGADAATPAQSAAQAAEAVLAAPTRHFNPFHLLLADRAEALLVWDDGERRGVVHLEPGVHVVTERSRPELPGPATARERAVTQRARSWAVALPSFDDVAALLAFHGEQPSEAVCVHRPAMNYGTRSASVIALPGASRRPADEPGGLNPPLWREADGPPCRARWTAHDEALRELLSWPIRGSAQPTVGGLEPRGGR